LQKHSLNFPPTVHKQKKHSVISHTTVPH